MKRIYLVVVIFGVVLLSCYLPSEIATPAVKSTATTQVSPTATKWIASVRVVQVYIRDKPGGAKLAYLISGDRVTILSCEKKWCEITWPLHGYIYQGCLYEIAGDLGCQAAE